ncbi:PAS domain-containing protein [Pontibacter ramchanderi]|uniref:histidine kinase n=1 Tax=Pontibacter ramchanderi TaxID=1179743 RepID=A0A2N3V310_9BACT|nr:PAS domain-containing protein [Pontibacter ramchanderi]PKV75956.1 PAS domain S-box-containing protein [Pontibacter ramchanderi]
MTSSFNLPQVVIQAFEKVPDLYLILSPELQVLTASDAYLAATHTIRRNITGKSITQMLSESAPGMEADAIRQLVCSLQKVLRTRQPHRLQLQQYYMPAPTNTGCCLKGYRTILNTPVLDDKGLVLYIIHKLEDATEKVKTVPEPVQSHQLLQTTIDSSLDMIQVFEAVRNESGEIIDFRWILNNRTSEEIYGDVLGKNLLEQNPGVVGVGIFDTFKRVVETGIPDQSERHYVHEQFDGWFYQSTVKLGDGVATTTRNITKRKQAEQELRTTKESLQAFQEQLQMVLANTASSIMLLRPIPDETDTIYDFEYLYANDQLLKSVNRSALVGRRFAEEFPGVKRTELFQYYIQVATEGGTWSGETHIDFDGFDVWAQVYATRVKENLLVTYYGITERKKAEEALVQSKELIQTVFDVSLNPIAYHKAVRDASGKIADFEFQLVNKAASKYAVSDHSGKRYSEALPVIRDTIIFKKYCEVVETGRKLDNEVQINLKGKDLWFHLQGVKMDDGLVATAVDITERKKSEQEILRLKDEVAQKATDKYQALFNTMDEGLSVIEMIYDADGKPVDLRLLEVNPAYEKITGLKNVAGKLGSEIVPSDQYWLDAYDSVVKTGKSLRYENYHAGARQWYRTHTSRIGGPGSHVIANLFEDITERKQRDLQQEFLLKFSDNLRNLSDEKAIEETGLRMLAEFLKLDRAYVFVLYPVDDRAVVRAEYRKDSLSSMLGEVRMSDFPETIRQIEDKTIVFNDIDNDVRLSDLKRTSLHAANLQAFICARVRKGEKNVIWSLAGATVTPRVWTKEEVELIEVVAERIWVTAERAKTEEALRKSEERHRTLFDSVDEGVCLFERIPNRTDGLRDYRYIAMNPTMQAMFSIPDLSGQSIRDNFPNEAEDWYDDYDRVLETGESMRAEHESGPQGMALEMFVTRVDDGSGKRLLAVMKDVTERKQRERQQDYLLKLNDTLRSADAAIEIEEKVTAVAMEYFGADRCYYCTIEGDHSIIRRDARKEGLPTVAGTYPLGSFAIFRKVIDDAVPFVVHNAADSNILDDELRQLCLQLQVISFIDVPVIKNGNAVGILCVVKSTPRQWTQSEISIAVETAERTWAAVERAKAEEALARSEEKYRTLFNSIDEGYCIIQMIYDEAGKAVDFRYLQVNQAFERNNGLYDAQGRTIRELAPDIEPKWMEIYNQVAQTGVPLRFEESSQALHRIFSLYAFRIGDPAEHKVAVIFTDITLRKQAEQQLHHLNLTLEQQVAERTRELNESKLFAEQITEATPDFIMIFNLGTNKVDFVNQSPYSGNNDRYHQTLQIGYKQLMSRSHPEDRRKLQEYINKFRTASDQEAHTLEYRVTDQGKTIWYRSRGKVFSRDKSGKPTHFISVVQDINDLKELEQENLQMRLEQQRTNLLAILDAQEEERRRISEGLHNGVGQILYTAKLHLSHYLTQKPKKANSEAPIRQVDQILDEAIRQTRGLSHQLAPALLEQFGLETAFKEIGNMLSTPTLQIQCLVYNLPKKLDQHLQIVVYRVAQEMANNIIRHANATEASLLLRAQRQRLILIAEDNGRGFDSSVSHTKGIGLSSIKNRVELLNGTFSTSTAPEQGTQVKITLPL